MKEKNFKESKFMTEMKKKMGEKSSIGFEDSLITDTWYSTGSKMLDIQLNGGRINLGGIAGNKLTVFAGPKSCGKTYFAIQVAKDFLRQNPNGILNYFDSERNVSHVTFKNSGFTDDEIERVIFTPVFTQEEYRTKMVQAYLLAIEEKIKMMTILDSVGGLIPQKEIDEASANPNKDGIADVKAAVGRPQQTNKSIAKMVKEYSFEVNAPAIFISHIYSSMGLFASNIVSGGEGILYLNSNCVEFSRSQSKDASVENKTIHDINGIIVTAKLLKSRFARELTKTKSLIHFNYGVLPYYGFISMLEQANLIKKTGNRYLIEQDKNGEWIGKAYWPKELNSNIDLIKPLIDKLEPWTIRQFGLGKMSMSTEMDEDYNNLTKIDFEAISEDENPDIVKEIENDEIDEN